MGDSKIKEVRFDKYCPVCLHYAHKFPKEDFSFEAQEPCADCLETFVRTGTEKPRRWEQA